MPTLQELDAELALLAEKLQVTKALADAMRAYEAKVGSPTHVSVTLRPRRNPHSPPNITEQVASELMERTGQPVPTATVIAELKARGEPVPARHGLQNRL